VAHPYDDAIDAARRAITEADGLLHVGSARVRGAHWPAFDRAPPDLPAYFAACCALYADRECLVDGAERLSFAQVHARARGVAAGLIARHGIRPGDHVGLAARNGAGWVLAYMGIVMAGGVATLVNAFWTGTEMAAAVRDVGCVAVLADRFRFDALGAADAAMPLILLDQDVALDACLAPLHTDPAAVALPAPGADAPATLLFTSGSTGESKGALSDHRAKVQAALHFAASAAAVAAVAARQGDPVALAPATLLSLPLFHVTGEVVVLLQSFALGRKMVVMRRWDPLEALRLIEQERITYVTGVPLMGVDLAGHPQRGDFDLSSLADLAAGGAPRPPEQIERLKAGLPEVWPSYGFGLTETNAVGTGIVRAAAFARPDSPGRATPPLVDLAILAGDGAALGPGQVGEIGVRSISNILCYWNRPADNARLFTPGGHVRTGDLGCLDEAGYLVVVGRTKDIIIRGGENIACPEVEAALYAVPAVRECAVFGVPDDRLGEVPVAVVHVDAGSGLDEAGLLGALAGRLAPYKRPVRIVIRDRPLPRLGSEKIDKRAVREAYLAGG
jgi:acyl-CoA synthetase (AMP-forming)/AMP-acid ligase II